MTLRIYIGPDEQAHGCCIATLSTEDGDDTLDAWRSTGPRPERGGRLNTWDWLALARRRLSLPTVVKRAGLRWDDADVRPYGWSPGGAYAPNGVTITWTVEE